MRMKVKQFIIITLLLFIIGGMLNTKPILAASAEVTIEADSNEITVGDNIFVYVILKSDTSFGDFEANLIYDEDILEYKGGASVISGGSGFLRISDMGVLDGDNSRKYTLKFEATEVGISKLAFSDRAMVYDYASGLEMSVSSNELTLNVKAPVTASSNTNLKSLNINSFELTPEFDNSIFEYNVNVSYDTEQLIITALPEDEKSTVSITGNENLSEGENKVIVSVLAESGDVIKYTINVTKEKAPEVEPTVAPTITPGVEQGSFEIVTIDGEDYAIYNAKYKLVEPSSDIVIPTGYKKGSLIIAGKSITAYLPINLEESEFLLIYAMNEMGDAGFYRYDRVEKTLLRYLPDSLLVNDTVGDETEEENLLTKKYNANLNKAAVVIAILCALCGVMVFVTIRLWIKQKRHK